MPNVSPDPDTPGLVEEQEPEQVAPPPSPEDTPQPVEPVPEQADPRNAEGSPGPDTGDVRPAEKPPKRSRRSAGTSPNPNV